MIKRKLFVVLAMLLILCGRQTIKAQSNSNLAIFINEFSASNVGTPVDNFGEQSDWVEIYNHHTQQVNLGGYFLSNDKNNLFKWKFPSTFIMGVETYSVVWLSGRNTVGNNNYHANFTLDQCKNQWLILTTPNGEVRDSVFVQKTKAGHSWGRVVHGDKGIANFKLFTAHSFLFPNPNINNYKGYCPKPIMVSDPVANPNPTTAVKTNAGGFYPDGATVVYFKLQGPLAYDTLGSCFDIYYTLNGDYPVVGDPLTVRYTDSISGIITVGVSQVIRAIAVPKPPTSSSLCDRNYLPSFCETNTYFVDPNDQLYDPNFAVLAVTMDKADTSWFNSNGIPANNTAHFEYYDKKKQISEGFGYMTRPPNEDWKTAQKGFNATIDDKGGFGCNFEGTIFNVDGLGASSRTVFPTLQVYAGDIESHSPKIGAAGTATSEGTALRDVFLQSLSVKYNIDVNPLHVKPVVVFKNGKYWGVFTIKEVYDKYYEEYYHGQAKESLDLAYYHNTDGYVGYADGSISRFSPLTTFKTGVYNVVINNSMRSSTPSSFYAKVMAQLDKSSFTDYIIMNSFAMNSNLWSYNIAYAKGATATKPGNKWHYYLWNMPAVFNYSAVATNTFFYSNAYFSPCLIETSTYDVSPFQAGNGHGMMMNRFMNPINGNPVFQAEYKIRYQDLLNTALKCENITKHFDYVYELYKKEMRYHEDPANQSPFATAVDLWDTNMAHLKKVIQQRCFYVANGFNTNNCYGIQGPYDIMVDVEPAGAGRVILNTINLDTYPWYGKYYKADMTFQAVPSNTTFTFDHWEFKTSKSPKGDPLSLDSIVVSFSQPDEVIAVFTDKSRDLDATNVPSGFTPNGDANNEIFKPLGSALFTSEYEMTVWSRWGEEVFRSLDPATGWDGNYRGQQAITGVYAYIIKYKNIYGESKLLKGNVTLTR